MALADSPSSIHCNVGHATIGPSTPRTSIARIARCASCDAEGTTWGDLRRCLSCGAALCCDTSSGRHARRHFEDTGHPVIASAEAQERWGWCYVDTAYFSDVRAGR